MALWLHEATHNAVAEEQLVASCGHCGNDGVVRSLATFYAVDVTRCQVEVGSSVLKGKAASFGHSSSTEAFRLILVKYEAQGNDSYRPE